MNNYATDLPNVGIGETSAFELIAGEIISRSAALDASTSFAHMDPPTPDIATKLVGLNARYNQNLLHPDLSPFASKVEQRLIEWIAPLYGMQDGHMCCGSSIANLTGIWCARENGAKRVVASADAHLSVAKAAHILAMDFETVAVDGQGKIVDSALGCLRDACLVLTAGTTGRGAVDPMMQTNALWTHVDAAWAGPLQLTKHHHVVAGIEQADSLAISAHKWLYQPKDSALVFFKDIKSTDLVSFGGDYLTVPNVGVQGSRSASAIPLFATLLAWGKQGLAERIEKNIKDSETLAGFLIDHPKIELCQWPETGVLNWRPTTKPIHLVTQFLENSASSTKIFGELWIRHVAANPNVNVENFIERIEKSVGQPI